MTPRGRLTSSQLYARPERAEEVPYEMEVAVTGKPHAVKVLVTGTYQRLGGQEATLEVVEMPGGKLGLTLGFSGTRPGVSPDACAAGGNVPESRAVVSYAYEAHKPCAE